jgi:hypothetical protein
MIALKILLVKKRKSRKEIFNNIAEAERRTKKRTVSRFAVKKIPKSCSRKRRLYSHDISWPEKKKEIADEFNKASVSTPAMKLCKILVLLAKMV